MAILYKLDGATQVIMNLRNMTYQRVRQYVGGQVEMVTLNATTVILVNEDGLDLRLPVNILASKITGVMVVGDVIVCSKEEMCG